MPGNTLPGPHALRRLRAKTWLGLGICAAGLWISLSQALPVLHRNPAVWPAFTAGCVAALATALGALPVLFSQRPSERMRDAMFGFGAGVMLAACAFSLILPGLDAARQLVPASSGAWAASGVVGAAMLLGAGVMLSMERLLPHEHFVKGREGASPQRLHRTWLFVIAIALHNLPEGLAIGVGQAAHQGMRADALTMGIAIQDVPEGLVVAAALLAAGYRRGLAVALGMATGLVEPLGAVLGALAIGHSAALLPWGLGFAAGAMLFIISHEVIPESHRQGHESLATLGLMAGFVLMMMLDTTLG